EEEGESSPVSISVGENDEIMYNYTGDEQLDKAESYVEMLIEKSHELDLMEEFITMDEIKGHAQNQLLEDGVNPGISVDQFEYVEMNNLNEFYSANNVEEDSN